MSTGTLVNAVRAGFYLDSVALMRLALQLQGRPGVREAAMMMGTPSNLALLDEAGLLAAEATGAAANDLVITILADDDAAAEATLAAAGRLLDRQRTDTAPETGGWRPRGLGGAALAGDANLALISVPPDYAALEAHRALGLGLDVMIFTDNVPLDEEVALKRRAARSGRLLMGPDCGTAYLAGVPLGFANAVPRGSIGVVAASGTGLQELAVLLAGAGHGLSHGIGVGGRDLSDEVGAIATLSAIERLARDPATERIALVSKPPSERMAGTVLAALAASGKPACACFVGAVGLTAPETVQLAATLREAAQLLAGPALARVPPPPRPAGARASGSIRGLFAGGTLCAEAQSVLRAAGLAVASNAPIPGAAAPGGAPHEILDLGADEHTRGRPHPMLEPAVRTPALEQALADPGVAVVLLDVVLGYGAHPDPAREICAAVARARAAARSEGPGAGVPLVIARVCGTDQDPQGLAGQRRQLEEAGIVLAPSNADAAQWAAAWCGDAAGGCESE